MIKPKLFYQGWAVNSTPPPPPPPPPPPYLPVVFTGLENTPKVANTGKYWSIELCHFERTTEILSKLN